MYYDRHDIIEAHYAFCVAYHGGQNSDLYKRQCRISRYYRPSPMWRGYPNLSDNGKEIYNALRDKLEARALKDKGVYADYLRRVTG